jgi:superfamily II DNA helicase RecQ
MSRVIPTKKIINIYLGAKSNFNNTEEQIESLNHRISYLENQHCKVKNNKSNFTRELSPGDKELLSYIEAKLKATKKLREKVIEDETLQEPRTSNNHENDEFTLTEMRDIAEKRWPKLIAKGYSENKAAKKISNEINNQRAAKTIKNWMHPEYT